MQCVLTACKNNYEGLEHKTTYWHNVQVTSPVHHIRLTQPASLTY